MLMKLEKLKDSREKRKLKEFPIQVKDLCVRYEKLYAGSINDVLREMNLLYQALPPNILPLRDHMKVAGIAFTIKGSKNLSLKGELEQRAKMLEEIHENSVVV